jgi:cellulose synthase/poly-beta-1,6-N-acetylglucosamine synthase-like glycosyltransferase
MLIFSCGVCAIIPLTQLFTIEYAALFEVHNARLAALQLPFPVSGSSNHFKTSVLREIHGWDAWNVTEDADIGLRLARFGYDVGVLDSTTREEAPVSFKVWLGQRRRWFKGWMRLERCSIKRFNINDLTRFLVLHFLPVATMSQQNLPV